jgi:serine/threonine protein kinase
MQYLAGGTLIEYVSKHFAGRRMSEQFGRSVFRQLASALDYPKNEKISSKTPEKWLTCSNARHCR